jgi:polysaccharide biosynthesis/export protein VpsN
LKIHGKDVWLRVVIICLSLTAAACSSNTAVVSSAPATTDQSNEYRLGTGDRLQVTVFGHDDLSAKDIEVGSGGRISLPLVGELPVVGHTTNEVETMIVSALSPNYLTNPVVSVDVIKYRDFYIIGEVANPGHYPYVGGMRAINAVALAGGFTYRAVEDEFIISRNGEQFRGGQGTPVYPGDVVEVTERFF